MPQRLAQQIQDLARQSVHASKESPHCKSLVLLVPGEISLHNIKEIIESFQIRKDVKIWQLEEFGSILLAGYS